VLTTDENPRAYTGAVQLQEQSAGSVEFRVVAEYRLPAAKAIKSGNLHSETVVRVTPAAPSPAPSSPKMIGFTPLPFPPIPPLPIPPTAVPIPPTPAGVSSGGATTATGSTTPLRPPPLANARLFRNDLGLSIVVPPGWQPDKDSAALGGPLSINTFNSQYDHGGIIPSAQAAIDITRVRTPRDIGSYISHELIDADDSSIDSTEVAGTIATRVFFSDSYTPGLAYDNFAVYLPRGDRLYKFFLTYHRNDPNSGKYKDDFGSILKSVKFTP